MLDGIINSNQERRPRRLFLYGTHGIGKSTFAANAPSPIFIPTEDGFRDLAVKTFPPSRSYGEFMERLWKVSEEPHEFKTVVIDTADWLETLISRQVCADGGKEALVDFGFGKGFAKVATYFEQVVGLLEKCQTRSERGKGEDMLAIVLAHSEVVKFNDPATENYDRYQPALHKSSGPMWMEWVDEVLFANYRVVAVESDDRQKTVKGRGRGERILFTTARPSHEAKNRMNLPDEMPLAFVSYWDAMQKHYAAMDEVFGNALS